MPSFPNKLLEPARPALGRELFTLSVSGDYQHTIDVLRTYGRLATPYVREWADRSLFSFRRDRIVPSIKETFPTARGRISQRKSWVIEKATGRTIDDISGRVVIESKAAYAHEFGAQIQPRTGKFLAIPNRGTKGIVSKKGNLNRSVSTPKKAAARGWKLFYRQYAPGKHAIFREVGRTKTGKRGKNHRIDLAFFLIERAKIKPKLGIIDKWQAYGPEVNKRLAQQMTRFWGDLFRGRAAFNAAYDSAFEAAGNIGERSVLIPPRGGRSAA